MRKFMSILMSLVCCVALGGESVSIKSVEAQQRYPWNGLVDIAVTIEGSEDDIAELQWSFVATNSAIGSAVPVESISKNGSDTGSETTWIRRFIWNATNDVGEVKIDDLALTVCAKVTDCVQLWEDGPYWAKCNVGAKKPEEYGYYFWWGDTVGYVMKSGTWVSEFTRYENVTWQSSSGETMSSSPFAASDCPTYNKDATWLMDNGYIDSSGNLTATYDAATQYCGSRWRLPTDTEFRALVNNCDAIWTLQNGVYGQIIKGKGTYASKCIFLPAAGAGDGTNIRGPGCGGCCWSSSQHSFRSDCAWGLSFGSSYFYRYDKARCGGRSIRPVRGVAAPAIVNASVTAHLKLDCCTGVRERSSDGEVLRYDASWYENGKEVRITDNGDVIVSGISGCYEWTPDPSCSTLHILQLEVFSNEHVIATESAQFSSSPMFEGGPYTETVDGIEWTYMVDADLNASVGSGTLGGSCAVPKTTTGAVVIPPTLGAREVKSIGNYAFRGCSGLTSVELPSHITVIGDSAFASCSGLTAFYFPSSVKEIGASAFWGCSNLRDVSIENLTAWCGINFNMYNGFPLENAERLFINGEEVSTIVISNPCTRVSSKAFYGCKAIQGVVISECVKEIGCEAFENCTQLQSLIFDGCGLKQIEDDAFYGCGNLTSIEIPPSVTNIGSCAFQECTSLVSVALNDGLMRIQYAAFKNCSALNTVNIPQTVERVGSSILSGTQYWENQNNGVVVLDGCALGIKGDASAQLVVPSGVRLIASAAFYGCSSSLLSLPNSLRVIGGNAFQGSKITAVELPLGVKTIGGAAFCNCGQLTRVAIPSSVRDIEDEAFMSCSVLANVEMSEGVERIGNKAFYGCKALSDISIPDSVKSIGNNAFRDCAGLLSAEIGSGIKSVGGAAFEGCTELQSFGLYGAPTNLGTWAFGGYGKDYRHLDAIKINDLKAWCANELGPNTCLLYFTIYNRSYSKLLLNEELLPNDLLIPTGVSRIGTRTFQYLPLTSVSLSSNVSSIGNWAFSSCLYLTNAFFNVGLKAIEDYAFMDCSRLTNITIPLSVESIGTGTFSGCAALNAVDFECPPPVGINNAAIKVSAAIRYNVKYETEWLAVIDECGWTNAAPYKPDEGFPDLGNNPTQEEIREVLDEAKDDKIKTCITNAANYNAYRVWANKIGSATVKSSANAWLSYAFGNDRLLSNVPTSDDLTVEEFSPTGENGKFDFVVLIDGVNVGGGIDSWGDVQKENLKQVFGLEGASTLDPNSLSSANVDITFSTPENGKVKFTAGPKNTNEGKFFMRAKVTP